MALLLSVAGTGGQSFEDKLKAMKYFISGQGLSFVVLKATTSEILGPKRKHLTYLASATDEPNVSIPKLVKCLLRRARHMEWSVAFKALITIHYLMDYGNEKFIQNLASSSAPHRTFEHLSSFTDRSCNQAYDMSTFVRRHSRYINSKIQTYRALGTDFCKIKTNGLLSSQSVTNNRRKTMRQDQLLMLLQTLQTQFDMLLAFDASAKDLNNGIINSAFAMLYKDFVKLYITYQSAIIRLLELYYSINQVKKLQELLDAYKKYLVRIEKVSDFMRVINAVGMDKNDLPDDITRLPHFNLKQLEARLKSSEQIYASSRIFGLERMQSIELPKPNCDYGTSGRRRSLRRDSSLTNFPPETSRLSAKTATTTNHKRRMDNDLTQLKEESNVVVDDENYNRRNNFHADYSHIDLDKLESPQYFSASNSDNQTPTKRNDNSSDVQNLLILDDDDDDDVDDNNDQGGRKNVKDNTNHEQKRQQQTNNNNNLMEKQQLVARQMPNDWVRVD